jgi:hypothetical protein
MSPLGRCVTGALGAASVTIVPGSTSRKAMDQRKRNAVVAVIVLIVVPIALIVAWRAWSEPGTLVAYTRSGGVAGVTEQMVVYRDGKVVVSGNGDREFHMADGQLTRLQDALAAGEWPRQPTVYGQPVPDGFQHDISYEGHLVQTYDGARPPAWLQEVLDLLGSIQASA